MDGLEVFQVGDMSNKMAYKIGGYTAVDDDFFLPKGIYKADEGVPIIFDSGCTYAVTPHEEDFVETIKPVSKVMNGLGAQAKIIGEGTVLWKFRDDFGVSRRVKVKAYLVPASKVRLFSPQAYFHASQGGRFSMNLQGSVFEFANGGTLTFEYSISLLPIVKASVVKKIDSHYGYLGTTGSKNISKAHPKYSQSTPKSTPKTLPNHSQTGQNS